MRKLIKRIYYLENLEIKCRILPIGVANDIFGYIVVWQTVHELTEFDYIAIEQASTIIALEMIKQREIEGVKLKIRNDFFDDLLNGKITSKESIKTLCDLHGLNPNYMYYCMVINIESDELSIIEDMVDRRYKLENKARKCVDLVYECSSQIDGEITCFHRNNRLIILI